MITVKDFMETVDYRITDGSEYCWQCFGSRAHRLDSWSGELHNNTDGDYTVGIVFDTATGVVYTAEVCDYKNDRAYRLTNPDFAAAVEAEAVTRGVDNSEAWDDVKFVDLESDADWIAKARAIIAGEDYDTRVTVEIDIDDATLFAVMRLAHERDITLNQMIEVILREQIEVLKSGK